jgi:hypothetical protein
MARAAQSYLVVLFIVILVLGRPSPSNTEHYLGMIRIRLLQRCDWLTYEAIWNAICVADGGQREAFDHGGQTGKIARHLFGLG